MLKKLKYNVFMLLRQSSLSFFGDRVRVKTRSTLRQTCEHDTVCPHERELTEHVHAQRFITSPVQHQHDVAVKENTVRIAGASLDR